MSVNKKADVYLKNGLKLEGYGPGGTVEEVSTQKINFFRDVLKFY